MEIAALIMAYKEPEEVNLLIKQLIHEFGNEIMVYIHVSRGSEQIIDGLFSHPQVDILPEHLGVDPKDIENNKKQIGLWARDGLRQRMMYMFRYVYSKQKADYYLILSGQDLIVRKGIKEFLNKNQNTIFMDGGKDNRNQGARLLYKWPSIFFTKFNSKFHPLRILRRSLLVFYSTGIRINRQENAHLFDGLDIYKNFYWMGLPSECIKYLIDYEIHNSEVMEIYRNSICPEESFFSTVLANNPKYHDMFNWIDKSTNYKGITYYGPFTTSFPLLEESDIKQIEESGMYLAKKFSISHNMKLVEYFYEKIMEG